VLAAQAISLLRAVAVLLVHQAQAPQLAALAQQVQVYAAGVVAVVVDPVSHLVLQQVLAVLEVLAVVVGVAEVLLLTQAQAELVVLAVLDTP
jgi:hypothetical protein